MSISTIVHLDQQKKSNIYNPTHVHCSQPDVRLVCKFEGEIRVMGQRNDGGKMEKRIIPPT